MEWPPEFSSGKPSPRRELQLQGPRPTPLKVRKDSHKIKKPPIPPQSSQLQQQLQHQQQNQQQQQQRQPVIIYTVSPKVIHTNASEFMSLVQRLTGSSTATSASTSTAAVEAATTTLASSPTGAVSPAARFATIEKTKMPLDGEKTRYYDTTDMMVDELFDDTAGPSVERTGSFPGILSPVPSSLPIVPPNFFSPPSDHNPFNFTHDFSPLFQQGNKNYFDGLGSFVPSPGSTFLSAPITSPTLTFDLFNQYLDY